MATIDAKAIGRAVYKEAQRINLVARRDIIKALKVALPKANKLGRVIIEQLIANAEIAKKKKIALCQDTGAVSVFIDLPFGTTIKGDIHTEIDNAVSSAYQDAGFRRSIVMDPIKRRPLGYVPAFLHIEYSGRKNIEVSIMAKGFGSENKSQMKMLLPTDGEEEIIGFAIDVVSAAGSSACPPYVLGVAIGGTFDTAPLMAKKALLKPLGYADRGLKDLGERIKKNINGLNIGPMGVGGFPTCLGVNITKVPTHIAGLPVAINLCCHSLRTAKVAL